MVFFFDSVDVGNLVLCRQQTWTLECLEKSHIQLGEEMEGILQLKYVEFN